MVGSTTLAPFYQGWAEYQQRIVQALVALTPAQLALQDGAAQRPIWLIATHIVGARSRWFQGWLGEGDPALAAYSTWDGADAAPHTAAELVAGLEATWAMIEGCLGRWTPDMLDDPFTRERPRGRMTHTRQWIIWHQMATQSRA